MNKNIILIGLMGAGKSAVGQVLCHQLSYQFLDTDVEIEKSEKKSISELFKEKGELYFREIESAVCQKLATYTQRVIATGGGVILNQSNRTALMSAGTVVWLKASLSTTLSRLSHDTSRPLLSENKESTLKELAEKRFPLYQEIAQIVIETNDKTINEIAQEIIRKL